MRWMWTAVVGIGLLGTGRAAEPAVRVEKLLRTIEAAGPQAAGAPAARRAWQELVHAGPAALLPILQAMDGQRTVPVNWLRTAFDRIADAELEQGGRRIEVRALLPFVEDRHHAGRARRLALDLVERLQPGTTKRLVSGWLDDPEFRYEGVAALLQEAAALLQAGKKTEARTAYERAFTAAREVQQTRDAAMALQKLGVPASVAGHLGFLRDWYVIGPFDAHGMQGFKTTYPPETKVDLAATLPGKTGPVRWKHYLVPEPPPTAGGHPALVNLRAPEALGDAEDAVAYAYTAIRVPTVGEVEFRGAADDNLTVWINGRRVFGFEEYRNGVRLDRHRFKARLNAGVNTVLVKVCQAPNQSPASDPNWEFLLRIVDPTGKGIAFQDALPKSAR